MDTFSKRTDTVSKTIAASPQAIYTTYLDPQAMVTWRPPEGMTCTIYSFDPRPGGEFRMSLNYTDTGHTVAGKTSEHADFFHGHFVELVSNERIVEEVQFESSDPAFAEPMTITTVLVPEGNGHTRVTITCTNVPRVIRAEDHEAGIQSTLDNLAAFIAHH